MGDSVVVVGAAGDRQLAFPVTVSRPLPKAVRVTFRVTGLTAVRGVHIKGVTVGVLTIPAGTTTVYQPLTIKPKPTSTSAKTLRINLSDVQAPATARLVRTQGIGTLLPH